MTDNQASAPSTKGGDVTMSSPYGTPLWTFQEECVEKLRHQLSALIGDDM